MQFADLGFEETVKKARFYMEVKDTSKPKKASVRFASTERDPAVNAITSSTVDLEPIMNCLQDIKGRMDKMERRGQAARASTPPSRSTSPTPPQSQNNQRGRTSPRPRNDNAGYQRDQFEDQQPQRFDDVPPQNYPVSSQPRRFQTSPVGWNDSNYRPPTQAWGGADPRFQGTPPWWTNPGPRYGSPQSAPTPLMGRGNWSGGSGRGSATEVSGSRATVAEVSRGTAAVLSIVRRTSNQPSVTRTQHHVQVPTRSHALIVVEAEVADVMSVGGLVATAAITRGHKPLSSVSSHIPRRCRQTTGPRETVPGVRQRATGLRHHPSARSPSRTTPTVRSTADFRPDLDWDAGQTPDFDRYCR